MKKIIILILITLIFYTIGIPKYTELNNLAIIEGVGVSYKDERYIVYLKEVIPVKNDQGIKYKYKYYEEEGDEIEKVFEKLKTKTKKKLYLKKAKFLITDVDDSGMIEKKLKKTFKVVYHPSKLTDILEKLKSTTTFATIALFFVK